MTAVHHLGKAFDEGNTSILNKTISQSNILASQKSAYHPSSGYYWKTNGSSGLIFAQFLFLQSHSIAHLDELTKKNSSKDKVLTHTQRARFDTIFTNYHDRFRPRVPSGTTTQSALPPSTTNNATAAIGGGGDNNLPRMYFNQ